VNHAGVKSVAEAAWGLRRKKVPDTVFLTHERE